MTTHFTARRFANPNSAAHRASVAVSSCLTGQRVRYDGNDKLLPAFTRLNRELDLIAICPEVGAGLPVPRPPVHLVAEGTAIRARGRDDQGLDVTDQLQAFARQSVGDLFGRYALCGYLWKSRSPSCGFNSTPLFDGDKNEIGRRSGIQATEFQRALPWLSYAEETDLDDDEAIDTFVLQCRLVFDIMHSGLALSELHTHYRFLIEHFPDRTYLHECCEEGSRENYLTALLLQCGQIDRKELLKLFRA